MRVTSRLAAFFLLLAAGGGVYGTSTASPGVTGNKIIFGQSGCFSGFCEYAGLQYREGILAAFHQHNQGRDVNSKALELLPLDDNYVPDRAAVNADWFISSGEVFAVVGGIGTPTIERMVPVLRDAGIPFVGHLTGAGFLADVSRFPNVVNVRAGYSDEVRQLVNHVFDELDARRFGIIYQDDAFGRSVLQEYEVALQASGLPLLAKASYSRHTHAVHSSVFVMEKADLDFVMLATAVGPASEAINTARSLGHDYAFGALSFVNPGRLKTMLDHPDDQIYLTKVTPSVEDQSLALVRSFHDALHRYRTAEQETTHMIGPLGLEGYIVGRFIAEVLKRMPDEISREGFLEHALTQEPVHIDDWVIAFPEGSNVGSEYVRLVALSAHDSIQEAVK